MRKEAVMPDWSTIRLEMARPHHTPVDPKTAPNGLRSPAAMPITQAKTNLQSQAQAPYLSPVIGRVQRTTEVRTANFFRLEKQIAVELTQALEKLRVWC